MFRNKWPLGSIRRGYIHPFHPLPAIVLLPALRRSPIFADLPGLRLAAHRDGGLLRRSTSLWFHFYRYKFVRRGDQFTMPWPKPQGY